MQIDDDQDDLGIKIKKFLSKDFSFRNPNFDPAPYLIKILKEKEANQDLIIKKQEELIQLENDAQELIEEITIENAPQFFKIIQLPQKFGEQLEKLKHNMSNVKKKVKETKSLLQMTQKDIQQIHLNCMFNKIIYKKLKEIELKLNQYETASLALKNNKYLQCAENLPVFSGNSILESSLATRSQNLRLRFLSQAIEQIRMFLYFTSKVILPTSHILIERANQDSQSILIEDQHDKFHKRYNLFKEAKCEEYLSQIWEFKDLERRLGKIGIVYQIIKGIMRIGKITEITESIEIDCKKSVSNIFLIISYFFAKDLLQSQSKDKTKSKIWFTSPNASAHITFFSAVLCICGALIRKLIIIRKIYLDYQITDLKITSGTIFQIINQEITKLIKFIYFPELVPLSTGYEMMQVQITAKIKNLTNFSLWPYLKNIITRSYIILCTKLTQIQSDTFKNACPELNIASNNFAEIDKSFMGHFHTEFNKTLEEFFNQEGRSFNLESIQQIISLRFYSEEEITFFTPFTSEENKALREYINLISFLNSLEAYFIQNQFQQAKYKKYAAYLLLYFFLKLHNHIYRYFIPFNMFDKIIQMRAKDTKLKTKEKSILANFHSLVQPRENSKTKIFRKNTKHQQTDQSPFKNVQKLRLIKRQNEMLFSWACIKYKFIEESKKSQNIEYYESEIQKLQMVNYEENISAKLIRVWDMLPDGETQLNQIIATIFRKLMDAHLNILAYIYIESGVLQR